VIGENAAGHLFLFQATNAIAKSRPIKGADRATRLGPRQAKSGGALGVAEIAIKLGNKKDDRINAFRTDAQFR